MVVLFMGVVVIVLLNLLIAIMGDSHEKVKESERVEALRERAQIIVEAEKTHPTRHKYHKYMHFVEAADSSGPAPQEWEGITGRMKQLLEVQDKKIDEINGKIDALQAAQDDINKNMEKILEILMKE